MITIDEITAVRDIIKIRQNKKRFEHTLGVAYTAASLAFIYDVDSLKAELAGILHDCAKCMSDTELIEACRRDNVFLTEEEINSPQVIHSKYGSFLAMNEYGIEDIDILNAVAFHTTGRENMSMLEKIIFTADYIEPLRSEAPNLDKIRKTAFSDIDECVYLILAQTVEYLESENKSIVPDTLRAYEWYRRERK